ncbi:hypothetical protein AVEN_6969-1 [Araneus ventricosus]|uniref:Uncharacterized protein n=1 Tax=Araneus ventricosus TaxID=182803 RepID=A0A4Y2T1C8_ARAVE|nr:hypothetical protein AVEN_183515-1 [Araneus ventricosus]GBN94394.1 hypothetical protein AVEN_6969-1 [Araneus ventricosus]
MGTLSMLIDEAAETPKCSPGTSNTISPFDISPVPKIKKRTTTRGRKATRSSLITGSPYKDQLTKSLEKSAPKKTSLSVFGVRNRPGGRGGKTKGLQKKENSTHEKIRFIIGLIRLLRSSPCGQR